MSDHITVGVPLFTYLGLIGAAPLIAVSVWMMGRLGRSQRRTLAAWIVVPPVLALLVGVALLPLSFRLAIEVAGSIVAGILLLWGLPVALTIRTLDQRGCGPETAALLAAVGLSVGLAASLLVFFAPGGPPRGNITFLTGPVAVLAWGGFLATVLLVPLAVALLLEKQRVD